MAWQNGANAPAPKEQRTGIPRFFLNVDSAFLPSHLSKPLNRKRRLKLARLSADSEIEEFSRERCRCGTQAELPRQSRQCLFGTVGKLNFESHRRGLGMKSALVYERAFGRRESVAEVASDVQSNFKGGL